MSIMGSWTSQAAEPSARVQGVQEFKVLAPKSECFFSQSIQNNEKECFYRESPDGDTDGVQSER